jgi:hypothetical protein
MPKIYHIIRSNSANNLFKEIIQESLHSGLGDEFFISSGFFQEGNLSRYHVSSDVDSKNRNYINNPFRRNMTANIRGEHNRYNIRWHRGFVNFCNSLRNAGYSVVQNNINRTHAKIFILQRNNIPFLEIIGSSNQTRPAYGSSSPFNKEADLIICSDPTLQNIISNIILNYQEISQGAIILEYSEENKNSIINEMIWIRDNFF